jgi:hypothetical protein
MPKSRNEIRRARAEEMPGRVHRTTAKSQNACRRRNTGTSVVLRDVVFNTKTAPRYFDGGEENAASCGIKKRKNEVCKTTTE